MAVHTLPLDAAVFERMLSTYKPHCRYLKNAMLEHPADKRPPAADDPSSWVVAQGECVVAEPCYYEEPGHLTAVEFNITYNQLLFAGLAGVIQHGLLGELRHRSLDEWWRH